MEKKKGSGGAKGRKRCYDRKGAKGGIDDKGEGGREKATNRRQRRRKGGDECLGRKGERKV